MKDEFDRFYESEKRKKDFEKYYVVNKYAKQKKRRRNFAIDRSHHYDKILEEAGESKSRGRAKTLGLVLVLAAMVFLVFQVQRRMETMGKEFADAGARRESEDGAQKNKKKKK